MACQTKRVLGFCVGFRLNSGRKSIFCCIFRSIGVHHVAVVMHAIRVFGLYSGPMDIPNTIHDMMALGVKLTICLRLQHFTF